MCKLDASAPDEGGEEVDDGFFAVCARTAKSLVEKQYYRTAVNVQHKTLEDFGRMESGARVPSRARGGVFDAGGGRVRTHGGKHKTQRPRDRSRRFGGFSPGRTCGASSSSGPRARASRRS